MKLYVTGLLKGDMGFYEQNRGNMVILIPMMRMLRQCFPHGEIVTSIQVSESWQHSLGFECVSLLRNTCHTSSSGKHGKKAIQESITELKNTRKIYLLF